MEAIAICTACIVLIKFAAWLVAVVAVGSWMCEACNALERWFDTTGD